MSTSPERVPPDEVRRALSYAVERGAISPRELAALFDPARDASLACPPEHAEERLCWGASTVCPICVARRAAPQDAAVLRLQTDRALRYWRRRAIETTDPRVAMRADAEIRYWLQQAERLPPPPATDPAAGPPRADLRWLTDPAQIVAAVLTALHAAGQHDAAAAFVATAANVPGANGLIQLARDYCQIEVNA